MKATRILCLLLAALLLCGSAVLLGACGDKTDPPVSSDVTTDSPSSSDVTTDPPETTAPKVLPSAIEEKFDDYSFKILIASRSTRIPNDFIFRDDGSVMDKAVYDRNMIMQDEHGVVLEVEEDIGSNHGGYAKIQRMSTAKDATYDYAVVHTYTMTNLATSGYLYDMSEVDSLNLSAPWWDQTVNEGVGIAGAIFFTSGDISHAVDDYMYCVIFNKEMYNTTITDGTDVYELVRNGTWTLDAMTKICSQVSEDLNGDDKMDSNDRYGLMTWCDEMFASIQAAGERLAKVNEDGLIEYTLANERVYNIVDAFSKIEQSPWCINFQTMTGGVSWPNVFSNNQAMFLMSLFNEVSRFRDMEANYGILPNPRYEENQERWYCTLSAGLANFSCMPGYQEDAERTGAILDLLGYYSEDTTSPAYYQKTLVGEKTRDDESVFCLDIIFNNKYVDIGHYFQLASLNSAMYSYVRDGKFGTFASMLEGSAKAVEVSVNRLNSTIEKLKAEY